MKLTDIKTTKVKEVVKEAVLVEKLGTLAQLGIGPLINLLKQQEGGRKGIQPTGKRFEGGARRPNISSTSEIVDVGVVKKGLTDIRKAYRTVQAEKDTNVEGFALYIDQQPVAFAIFDADELAGSTRTGRLAYDLTAFKPAIEELDKAKAAEQAAKSTWHRREPDPTKVTTAVDQEEKDYDYSTRDYKTTVRKYQGEVVSTSGLKDFMELATQVAGIVKKPITAKLVLLDKEAMKKRQKRYSTQEILDGGEDLMRRLAIYKNSKKPTAETVEEFIAMSLKNPGKQARFAGVTYSLKSSTYDKVDPTQLLRGKPFTVRYGSTDPGVHNSLELTYAYNIQNNQLLPIYATWYDKTDPADRYKRQEGVLNPEGYLRMKLGIANLEDKPAIMKSLLEKFKTGHYYEVLLLTDSLRKSGIDWSELDAVQKSATIEYDKQKKA